MYVYIYIYIYISYIYIYIREKQESFPGLIELLVLEPEGTGRFEVSESCRIFQGFGGLRGRVQGLGI